MTSVITLQIFAVLKTAEAFPGALLQAAGAATSARLSSCFQRSQSQGERL